jgi:hypothetical protein
MKRRSVAGYNLGNCGPDLKKNAFTSAHALLQNFLAGYPQNNKAYEKNRG